MKTYEVVISGMSGLFPECGSVADLEEKLMAGEMLVTDDDRKWPRGELNVPSHVGKIKDCFKFDQSFFGVHRKLCNVMDVHTKHSLERTFEAICDAGINPSELKGSKTAVVMSSMTSESEYGSVMVSKNSDHAMLGHSRCMQANRISYFFNFRGPSVVFDSSWVGGFQALHLAHKMISSGSITNAVVGATNLIFGPEVSIHYDGLCRLNKDGKTKSFSADADGYSRSEGIVCFFLQRAEDAKRSYGSIVKVMCSSNMTDEAVYPDYTNVKDFLEEFYSTVNININDLGYLEADGCASLMVDALELNCISQVLCKNRKEPLMVGSCKSRLGHTESASCFVSLVNALIAIKTGYIPATGNYSEPNPHVPSLRENKIKIVTEKTPFKGDYVAVNCLGVVSTYGHVLIKKTPSQPSHNDGLPRLLVMSGRTEEDTKEVFDKIAAKPIEEEFFTLAHHLFKSNISKHLYRAYLLKGEGLDTENEIVPFQSGFKYPVWFVFSGMGSQWPEMGTSLMRIPTIAKSIQKCHEVLKPKGIDLIGLITSPDPSVYDDILNAFVGIATIQIALVDLLNEIGIVPDGIVGHSVGELGCAYVDGCMTAEQVILAAYARGKASNEATLIRGMMAAVGKGYNNIKNELPPGIEVACHNSATSCTLSGPAELMESYVQSLKAKGVFAKLVNVANIAYHSKNIAPAAPYLLKYLKEIIPNPKMRSAKWVSSSVPEDQWGKDSAKYCSAEYHTNNLLSYVLFEEAASHIPKEAVTIEIAPHGLLQAILKRSLVNCKNISLTNRSDKDGVTFLLRSLGKLFINGVDMDLTKLYPKVNYPITRGADYIHPLINWEHSETWIPISLEFAIKTKNPNLCWNEVSFTPEEEDMIKCVAYNRVNSSSIFPYSTILVVVKDIMNEKMKNKRHALPTVFQNIKFHEIIKIDEKSDVSLQILLQFGSGEFEVLSNNNAIITGKVLVPQVGVNLKTDWDIPASRSITIKEQQIYNYFEERGHYFSHLYRNIKFITIFEKGFKSQVSWNNNIIHFLDSLLKLAIFYFSLENDTIMEPDLAEDIMIDLNSFPSHPKDIDVFYDSRTKKLFCDGIVISCLRMKEFKENEDLKLLIGKREFVPYGTISVKDYFYNFCSQLAIENIMDKPTNTKITIVGTENNNSNISLLLKSFSEYKYKVETRKLTMDQVKDECEISNFQGVSHCFIFLSEGDPKKLMTCLKEITNLCFVIHSFPPQVTLNYPKHMTPLIDEEIDNHRIVFLKKSNLSTTPRLKHVDSKNIDSALNNGLQMSENSSDPTYLIFDYDMMFEINKLLQQLQNLHNIKSLRYMFIDNKSPPFNPSMDYFKDQISKDLKMNISKCGTWGSLRQTPFIVSNFSYSQLTSVKLPVDSLKCSNVAVKCVGFNLNDFVLPNDPFEELGVLEYSGLKDGKGVFGLGRLTDDNIFEPDPLLWWTIPKDWTVQQATSIPLIYTMAYYILGVLLNKMKKVSTLLIQCGHIPFSQAVIDVALNKKMRVFTTCFSKNQKEFIKKRFPQILESDISLLTDNTRDVFHHNVMEATEGVGIDIVINPFSRDDIVYNSTYAVKIKGQYFHITNNSINSEKIIGMGCLMKYISLIGVNPNNLLLLPNETKKELMELVENGIKSGVVKYTNTTTIQGPAVRNQVAHTVVANNQQEIPRKVVMNVESKKVVSKIDTTKRTEVTKKCLIIGGSNGLWYDLMTCMVAKGIERLYIVVDESDIPEYIQRRMKYFLKKHNTISVKFLPTSYLKTTDTLMDKVQNGIPNGSPQTLSVIYINRGIEKELNNVDMALRKIGKNCLMICIGVGTEEVCESRKKNGYRCVSIVLNKQTIKNRPLLNVIEKVLDSDDEKLNIITLDHIINSGEQDESKIQSYLPTSISEVVYIGQNSSAKPCFVEIPTHTAQYKYSKGSNPLFVFPGFKVAKMKNLISKIIYPSFEAQFPDNFTSLDSLAQQLSLELERNFDLRMFTLLGESWSGALILKMAKCLEMMGKSVEVILIEAAPNNIKKWATTATPYNNIISKYSRVSNKGTLNIDDLKARCDQMCEMMNRAESSIWEVGDIKKGLLALFNRLSSLEDFKENFTISSKVHLFRPARTYLGDSCDLNNLCDKPIEVHISESEDLDSMLDSDRMATDLNSLVLLEYKHTARPQDVNVIGTLDLILDAKYQTEGLTRH